MRRDSRPNSKLTGKAALAQQVVDLCDQILTLGRGQSGGFASAVGEYEPMVAPSGRMGRLGCVLNEKWEELAKQLDDVARRMAQLVEAIDPQMPTDPFYLPGAPKPLVAFYPESRFGFQDWELGPLREHVRSLNPEKSDAEIDAVVASGDRFMKGHARSTFTKPQWPGAVIQSGEHVIFVSNPGLVHNFEQRFGSVKTWAEQIVKDSGRSGGGRPKRAGRKGKNRLAANKAPALDKEGERVRACNGKWYDLTPTQFRMLKALFEAKGHWVGGPYLQHAKKISRPDKARKSMPRAVRSMIASHRLQGYRIPALLSE